MRTININFGQNFVNQSYQRKSQNPLVLSTLSKDTYCPDCPRFKQGAIAAAEEIIPYQFKNDPARYEAAKKKAENIPYEPNLGKILKKKLGMSPQSDEDTKHNLTDLQLKNLRQFLEEKKIERHIASNIKQNLGVYTLPHAVLVAASFDKDIANKLAQAVLAKYERLTEQQLEILFKMIEGKSTKDIGNDFSKSQRYVELLAKDMYNNLGGAKDRKEAIKKAIKAIDDKFFLDSVDKLSDLPQFKYDLEEFQLKILFKMIEGKSNLTIGEELFKERQDIEYHINKICEKLDVNDSEKAIEKAIKEKFFSGLSISPKVKYKLTNKQLIVLCKMVEGKDFKTIADELGIDEITVKNDHFKAIKKKLAVNDEKEAIEKAEKEKFFPNILTKRRLEILFEIAQGKNEEEIAKKLGIKEGSVSKRKTYLYKQLGINKRWGLHNNIDAVKKAIKDGIIEVSEPDEKLELSKPELDFLTVIIQGKNKEQIKKELDLFGREARKLSVNIKKKFGVEFIEQAAILAMVGGYIDKKVIFS